MSAVTTARHPRPWTWLLVLALIALVPAGPSAAATSAGCAGWRIVPSPTPRGSANIPSVVAFRSTAWAVGFSVPAMGGGGTVALHRVGGHWISVPPRNPDPTSNRLDAVDGLSDRNVWAVGTRENGDHGTLVEHWNGSAWSVVPSPSPPNTFNGLDGISVISPTDVWAVGYAQSMSGPSVTSLAEHWDGHQWQIVPSPNPGDENYLLDVFARSATDVWAVGQTTLASKIGNLVVHWNGTSWRKVPVPSPGFEYNALESVVALGPHNVWAVGNASNEGTSRRQPLTFHWNGTAWKQVPNPRLYGQLNDVASTSEGRLWAVGYREGSVDSLIERWNGSSWRIARSANLQGASGSPLFGVATTPTQTWAVGAAIVGSDLHTVIERPCA